MADNFTIPIKGETKDLLSKLRDASKKLLSFGKDAQTAVRAPQAELQQLNASLNSFGSLAKTALAGLVGGIGIKSLTKDFMDYHANLSNAVQVMGYDVTQVEALGGAMRRFGGDTSGAISSLDSLSSALQQARFGQGALIETGAKFGIQYMKTNGQLMSSEELLQSLSKQLNKYDKQTKIAIASQLGLDSALLRVIDSGNFDTMIASQKKLNTTTKEDLKIATDLESAWLDFRDSMSSIAKEVSRVLLPPLTKLMRYVTDMLTKIKEYKNKSVIAWGAVAVAVVPVLTKVTALAQAFSGMSMMGGLLKSLQTGFATFGTAVQMALSPVGLIIAAFLVLFLVAEDLYTYFSGGKSVFGELAKQYPMVQGFLDGLGRIIEKIKTSIESVVNFFKNPSFDSFYQMAVDLGDAIYTIFEELVAGVLSILSKPAKWVDENLFGGKVGQFMGWVGGGIKSGYDKLMGNDKPKHPEGYIPELPPHATSTLSGNNETTNKQVVINTELTQNIQTNNPQVVGDMAKSAQDNVMRTTMKYK